MQLDNGTNSIVDEARFLAKASTADLPKTDIVRLANQALDRLNSLVLGVERALQFDDLNYTDNPTVSLTITSGTPTDTLPDDGNGNPVLAIDKIVVPNPSGTASTILNAANINDDTLQNYLTGTIASGAPQYFRITGNSITYYPTPSYSATATAYIRRNIKYFTDSDTTASPGFAAPFHRLVPLWIAYWYSVREGKKAARQLMDEIRMMEEEFIEYYSDSSGNLRLQGAYADPR